MPWSRTPANPRILYGNDGEWVTTCSTPEVAAQILNAINHTDQHTMDAVSYSTPGPDRWLHVSVKAGRDAVRKATAESRKFSSDVDAIIDIADKHLAGVDLANGWKPIQVVSDSNAWTTKL